MNISFLKFQLILKEVVFIMKEQLNQLSAYQPGLSPRALKEKYGIEGDLYKLASNENSMGTARALEAISAHLMSYIIILKQMHRH